MGELTPNKGGDPNRLAPNFTGRVDLGHIIQAVMLLVVVGGGMLGSYFAVQGRISAQAETISVLQQQMTQMDKKTQQTQDDQRQFSRDIAQTLNKVSDQITDLRVLVAGSIKDGRK